MIYVWLNLLLVIIAKIYIDWRQWKAKHVINHPLEIAIVAVDVGLVTYWLEGWKPGLLLLQSAVYWNLFDYAFNISFGQKLFYVGSTDFIDRFFRRFYYPELVMLIAKIIWLLIAIYLYNTI